VVISFMPCCPAAGIPCRLAPLDIGFGLGDGRIQRGPEVSDLRTVVRGHFAVWPENLDLTSAESAQPGRIGAAPKSSVAPRR
jgi:hypothetical protein